MRRVNETAAKAFETMHAKSRAKRAAPWASHTRAAALSRTYRALPQRALPPKVHIPKRVLSRHPAPCSPSSAFLAAHCTACVLR